MAKKDESTAKKQKVVSLDIKFKSNINGVIEKEQTMGIFTLHMQPEKLSEGKLIDINEESSCNEKDKDAPVEKATEKHFTLKQLLEIFYNIESTKDKILEAHPNLERNMRIS